MLAAACGIQMGSEIVAEAAEGRGCIPQYGAKPTTHTLNAVLSACIDAAGLWKGAGAESAEAVSSLVGALVNRVGVDSVTHNLLLSRWVSSRLSHHLLFVCWKRDHRRIDCCLPPSSL